MKNFNMMMMKMNAISIEKTSILALIVILVAAMSSCSEKITDFGFDGQISGMVLDQNGNPVSGDITNAALTVFLLGDEDRVPLEVRVQGDGSYANLHLYPQSYTVWIEGPVDGPGEGEMVLNLSGPVEQNITVTPFLVISEPTASVSGNELTVNYDISPSTGHTAAERRILVSTVAKVGVSTGSGPRYITRTVTVNTNSGAANLTLDSDLLDMAEARGGGDLTIRVAARSDQTSDWNYSVPIVVDP